MILFIKEVMSMTFQMVHNNFNVFNLDKSLVFYKKALGLNEVRRINAVDDSFIIVFLEDGNSSHQVELTWLRDRKEPYNLGDNEIHLCFRTDDYDSAYRLHKEMGCICYENMEMGLYFITDPDGYWMEIVPKK